MRLRLSTTAVLTLALAAPASAARWDVVREVPPDVASYVEVAVVGDDAGHTLRVYRDGDGIVQAMLAIRGGFDTLSDTSCPTFQVDDHPPVVVGGGSTTCAVDAKRTRFALGAVEDGVVHSNALLELMNGSRLYFRYRMPSLGYRETVFSLRGSKQALNRAIGPGVEVTEE